MQLPGYRFPVSVYANLKLILVAVILIEPDESYYA